MAITIVSDKISDGLKAELERGRKPNLCIKLANGCRVGLPYAFFRYPSPPGNLSQGDWPRLLSSANVQKVSTMSSTYFCEAEPDCNDPQRMVNYRPNVVAKSIDQALAYGGPCEPCQQTGGFPRPKNIVEQLVEGLYTLATTNPAILACLMVGGPGCPILSVLQQLGVSWDAIRAVWAGASVSEISRQISTACQALNIRPENCPTYLAQLIWNEINKKMGPVTGPGQPPIKTPIQPPPVSQDSIAIYVNKTLVAVVPAARNSDGSYSVSASLPIVGDISFSVNFSTCALYINASQGYLQVGLYAGVPSGSNACSYTVSNYNIELKLIRSGQRPPEKSNGWGGQIKEEDWIIIGVLALAAIAAFVLISR
ncbi:MAG: hypothetical protein QXO20_07665 [Candidatus Bathyarchaeia archaeon]